MKSRLPALGLAAIALVAIVAFLFFRPDTEKKGEQGGGTSGKNGGSATTPGGNARPPAPLVKQRPAPPKEAVVLEDMLALSDQLNSNQATVQDDLEILEELFAAFQRFVGSVPEGGLNDEIVAGLLGGNEKKLVFLRNGHPKLNEQGELLDRFGTPYYFHPLSSDEIEIRSAGPDGLLFTEDDAVPD